MNKIAKLPIIRFFLNSKEVLALIIKIILMIAAIPWCILMLLGLVFDKLTKLTSSQITIYAIAGVVAFLVLLGIFNSVWAIIRFVKYKKHVKTQKTRREAEGGNQ